MPHILARLGVFLLVLLASASAWAVPRMSLIAGTPCDACHINNQGAGMRTEIGWGTGAFTGMAMYEDVGLEAVTNIESNFYLEGLVGAGIDLRLQAARLGQPGLETNGDVQLPGRVVIPMQIQPYLAIVPTDWLTLYGTYNLDAKVLRGGDDVEGICDTHYDGSSCFEAMAKIQVDPALPTLRAGQLQPYIGVRHDDHTMWIRRDASQVAPIIAPNYADLGADLSYQPVYWFRADAGGYVANNLSDALEGEGTAAEHRSVVGSNALAYSGRVQFLPQFSDQGVTSWLGASVLGAGSFMMQNYFVGVGDRKSVV